MALQYIYTYPCNHKGVSPTICTDLDQPYIYQPYSAMSPAYFLSASQLSSSTISLFLPFQCPLCTISSQLNLTTNSAIGLGIVAALTSTSNDAFPSAWQAVKICRLAELQVEEWKYTFDFTVLEKGHDVLQEVEGDFCTRECWDGGSNKIGNFKWRGGLRHMAWFDVPVGQVSLSRNAVGREGVDLLARVQWRGRLGGAGRLGGFGGLLQSVRGQTT